ncbi:mechanosensitive ion channel [Campylobacter sp. FMV-PI01]|uniref:Mechanosensitive ion channel n=1 Tax=Campylobacter portucalensis TaxID=2608384 RepID=A0A6L5WGK4_9BACT|nr:mechanosensitive ion channel domain-containing protein [Campylobacter portucalensis]MSN96308.1 mechanosensitive ion channel [Campylobacter portucalensis]
MRIFFLIFIFLNFAIADVNSSSENSLKFQQYGDLKRNLISIDDKISQNIWFIQFQNYQNYQNLKKEYENLKKKINETKKAELKDELKKRQKTIYDQLELLKEYEKEPFTRMLEPKEIEMYNKILTPFGVIGGISYIKTISSHKTQYLENIKNLDELLLVLQEKDKILNQILISANSDEDKNLILTKVNDNKKIIDELLSAKDTSKITYNVYVKKIDEIISNVRADINIQVKIVINISILIIFVILITILFKYIVKKSISDSERVYMANKIINFININLILLIILFAYIENVSYLVTLLGFASAGLAIAMKDMFMSMLGWMVIVVGGTFRVGDRIKVRKINGEIYIGDIVDISLLRMTIYEDITMTTYKDTRRAGRIIFVPNNYIFTELISNYTHSGMKTVWDGIDILLTFDSNHKKAVYIIKNIVRKYSKGYTDIAKKQMSKLRSQYSIKNPNVEPRIFTLFEPFGIKISVWYMTNSYATLGLRSTISAEILESIQKEKDIEIAYPIQNFHLFKTKKQEENFSTFKNTDAETLSQTLIKDQLF